MQFPTTALLFTLLSAVALAAPTPAAGAAAEIIPDPTNFDHNPSAAIEARANDKCYNARAVCVQYCSFFWSGPTGGAAAACIKNCYNGPCPK